MVRMKQSKTRRLSVAVMTAVMWLAVQALGFDVKLTDKGININADAMGGFNLSYPQLTINGKDGKKPIEIKAKGNTAALKYEGGVQLDLANKQGKVNIAFKNAGNVQKYRMDMMIPFNFNDGGKWKAGDQGGPFPKEKPAKPQFYQGNSNTLQITSDTGKVFSLKVPQWSFQQLQDNREWGWKIFCYTCFTPFNKDNPNVVIEIKSGPLDPNEKQEKTSVLKVDKFGQPIQKDYPSKVKSADEFTQFANTEKAYYDKFPQVTLDSYGGLPDSGVKLGLKKTGFFHVEKKGERWILVDPEGNAFFHLGVCVFGFCDDYTYIEGRKEIFEWLPPQDEKFANAWHENSYWKPRAVSFYKANVIRKYGSLDDHEWKKRMINRVKKFGFNSIGAFSGGGEAAKEEHFPYAAHLPLGLKDVPGIRGVFDPFDNKNIEEIDRRFQKSVLPNANEPLIIGYFLANEQGFEDLPRAIPALDGTHPCKQRLIKMLQEKYKNIDDLNKAWGTKTTSFDKLLNQGLPVSTKAAFKDMHDFSKLFLEAYYKCIAEPFRKYDKNHMLIGNRWQPGTANNELLCQTAGKYMDVISINYYTDGIDTQFVKRLYDWTGGKPQMWSEFYFTSEKESSVAGGGHDLNTQKDRGLAYRHYVEGAAALGFVVGIEWFTLIDQAVTGRFFSKYNGERNNTGIFDVCDRPYEDMIAEMLKTNQKIYQVWLDGSAPYLYNHPRFNSAGKSSRKIVEAGRPEGTMKIDGNLAGWPGRPPLRIGGDRLVLGRESGGIEASFKTSWDDKNLYLLINVTDPTPMKNDHSDGTLWSADGVELFIGSEKIDQPGAFLFTDRQILIGAGKNNQTHVVNMKPQPEIETAVIPSVDGKGYTMEVAIPWKVIDIKPMEGTELLFDIGIDDSTDGKGRRAQLMWNGIARNSSDRGAWGKLKLVR